MKRKEIKLETILVSVSNKFGLNGFIENLLSINEDLKIIATGGTYKEIKENVKIPKNNLIKVSDYTGFPEIKGLVKTLHPKIHMGILLDRGNKEDIELLKKSEGYFIDMVVANLYPFSNVIKKKDCTPEEARKNIDIGGSTLLRATGKNSHSCFPVVNSNDYNKVIEHIKHNNGNTTLKFRLGLARTIFGKTGKYDMDIDKYLKNNNYKF